MTVGPHPTVRRISADRLRLEMAPDELLRWVRRQESTARVEIREDGVVDVVAREPHACARLARSVADRLFVARRRRPEALDVRVAHVVPGRARLVVSGVGEARIAAIGEWLRDRPGVSRARPSPASSSIVVWFDVAVTSAEALARDARESDPRAWPATPPDGTDVAGAVATTAVLASCVGLAGALPAPVLGVAVAATAAPSVKRAIASFREGRVGVDALDVVAIGLSIGTGRFATGAFITWLLSLGDLLLARTQAHARRAITGKLDLDAADAHRLRGAHVERVRASALRRGDRIIIAAGARIAADGVVEDGTALVDEKALTGESMPRERGRGERVLSASVVVDGQIVVLVERVGSETAARKIAEVLAGAGTKPMTLQKNAERVADRLVLPTFALAGAVGVASADLGRVASILITDFGTGIRIAVPTAALATMASAAANGVLVKGGQFLERLATVDTVVFDKTGTLTRGVPEVVAVDVTGGASRAECLALAAAVEARQHHPVATAVRRAAEQEGAPAIRADIGTEVVVVGRAVSADIEGVRVIVGSARAMQEHGIEIAPLASAVERHLALGASSVFVARGGRILGCLGIADEPRIESAEIVARLRADKRRRVILLSGDTKMVARTVGASLGVDYAEGELLPDDKVRYVRELQAEGRVVAMVGDGLNDAPALAVADVGISIHGGTDVALEAADVLLLDGGLTKLPEAFALADRGMASVRRSLAIVLVPNAIAIALGAAGLIAPGAAALVNNGSTIAAALAAIVPALGARGARLAGRPRPSKGAAR